MKSSVEGNLLVIPCCGSYVDTELATRWTSMPQRSCSHGGAAEIGVSAKFTPKIVAMLRGARWTDEGGAFSVGIAAFVTLVMVGATCPKADTARANDRI